MNDWFRSWHGAPTDPKWLVIAKRAGVPPLSVSAIAWALFDHASQAADRGSVADFDFETFSALMGVDEQQVRSVYEAMESKGVVVSGRLAKWDKRQPRREDSSAERVRNLRKRRDPEAEPSLPLTNDPRCHDPPPVVGASGNEPSPADSEPLISPEAIALADQIAVIVGHNLEFVPPAWCGAASRVHVWLKEGWRTEVILQSVRGQMQRKRDGPPDRVQYFEKGIARAHAQTDAPLPVVKISEPEVINAKASLPATGGFRSISRDLRERSATRRAAGSLRLVDGSGDT